MKNQTHIWLVIFLLSTVCTVRSQTFTMSAACRDNIKKANAFSEEKKYDSALALFSSIEKKCNSKDGKEAVQCGKAHAYNGKKQYNEAITASNEALKVSKNSSLNAFFERAIANEGLKNNEAATADFNKIIELTEKNRNVTERATLYAKVADMHYQAGKIPEGDSNLAKAMELDPNNPLFQIQRGDRYTKQGKYDQAFEYYDKAVAMGKSDVEMYQIRTEARLKMVQDKYGTTNAQELRSRMTAAEKEQVCSELNKALQLGLKDMKLDMFSALVCK